MNDEEAKRLADLLNKQIEDYKCLRHKIYQSESYCRLCEAKREAKEHFEYARKLFTKNYGTP